MNVVGIVSRELDADGRDVYGVHFPDFPGATTCGVSLSELSARAGGMLESHISGMVKNGDPLPPRLRTVREIAATLDCGTEDAYAQLIVVVLSDFPPGGGTTDLEDQI